MTEKADQPDLRMCEGYDHPESDDRFANLNEFICDYVDGTMDRAARDAFKEYLRGNPELAAHVQALIEARQVLRRCRCRAPRGFQSQLRRELAREELAPRPPLAAGLVPRLGKAVAVSSGLALLLLVGMWVGGSAVAPSDAERPILTEEIRLMGPRLSRVIRARPAYQHADLQALGPVTLIPSMHRPLEPEWALAVQRMDAAP